MLVEVKRMFQQKLEQCCNKGKENWTPAEQAAWVRRPIRSLEVQLAGASENLELDLKLKEKLKCLKTQKLQNLMTLNRTREKLIDPIRKRWAKTVLRRKEIPDPECQFKLKSCLKQRNNWSTEAGEWQTARTNQETREGYWCSHCMLQSAMEQHAFTVWEPRWVEKMKEIDRALWEDDTSSRTRLIVSMLLPRQHTSTEELPNASRQH